MEIDTTYHEHQMRSRRFYAFGFNAGQQEEFLTPTDAWKVLVRDGKDAHIPHVFNRIRTTWEQQDALLDFGAGFTAGKLAPVVKKLDSGYEPIVYLPMIATPADARSADDEQWVEVDTTDYLDYMRLTYFTDQLPETTDETTFTADLAALMIADSALSIWPEFAGRSVGRRILVRLDKTRKEDDTLWPLKGS